MNEESGSESSSVQVNSQNNYKYDKYGFVLVNSIEDLLYDKFNNNMEKDFKYKKKQKDKNDNGYGNNSKRNFLSIPSKRGKKNKDNMDKSMKIILNINNKEKKMFKINPNDSKSIETNTIKDKETDSKNNNTYKSNKFINKKDRNKKKENEKKKEKYLSHRRDSDDNDDYNDSNYNNNEQFTFCNEEKEKYDKNLEKIRKMKKKFKKKNSIESHDLENISENENDMDIYDSNKYYNKSKPKNMKKNCIKNKKLYYYYSLPILYPCIISKTRKMNPNIKRAVPKSNRVFITKTYENDNKEKNKKILTWPNSTICYFNRSNKIINVNIHIPMQNVINRNYFCTKEIVDSNKLKYVDKKRLSKNSLEDEDSNNIIIKIINPEKSPFKYGKINIKTGSGKKSASKSKSYVFKIHGSKVKKYLFKNNSALSRSRCLKNKEIRNAFNSKKSKTKSKNKKKETLSPECITLRRRKKFGDKIYKKVMKKKALFNPQEYRISIKTKFKNNMINNLVKDKKEEEKIIRNNSMNRFDLNNNNKNVIYPYIKRTINDENDKNKSLSFLNSQKAYSGYQTLSKYNSHNNNDSHYFPAINSYFH